ncbi:uncharacterized protein K452DRAFT_344715 [Aplosporella prunicola CBS 121167]|uniref:Uncharacterized protein n=1 Tax=Aplosporella prunicola CBS 121167 TaxID=1176127 RepID=A0A6A6BPZ9_9PEZI|nr:uncharacterized protein K452DRAFT_344715 [Aplosporella prunicola CBS 121167]KAF2144651.1 hypothetical protein K452DRAFT_344715 [Aplosporella prunicola CBS 121167]
MAHHGGLVPFAPEDDNAQQAEPHNYNWGGIRGYRRVMYMGGNLHVNAWDNDGNPLDQHRNPLVGREEAARRREADVRRHDLLAGVAVATLQESMEMFGDWLAQVSDEDLGYYAPMNREDWETLAAAVALAYVHEDIERSFNQADVVQLDSPVAQWTLAHLDGVWEWIFGVNGEEWDVDSQPANRAKGAAIFIRMNMTAQAENPQFQLMDGRGQIAARRDVKFAPGIIPSQEMS